MPDPLLEVGRIIRPHGLQGELQLVLSTNRAERAAVGSELRAGDRVLRITHSRPHKNGYIVRVDGVNDRTSAEALAGVAVAAEPIDADEGAVFVHELVGATVVEVGGTERGTVTAVEANPAADLLVLDSGALVPLNFAVEISDGRIVIDAPDGLFDL
jgi:16S rRNA processing protein RimM